MNDSKKNTEEKREYIKGAAVYASAALILILFVFFARIADKKLFAAQMVKPAETAAEAVLIVCASVYLIRHRGAKRRRSIKKQLFLAFVPLALLVPAFFYLPDAPVPFADHTALIAGMLLLTFSDDLLLCSVGCAVMIHKRRMMISGTLLMLVFMAVYEAVLADEHGAGLVISVAAAVITGFFEIQFHIATDSVILCAIYHFLVHLLSNYFEINSAQPTPFFGEYVSLAFYIASLLSMLLIGVYLLKKNVHGSVDENGK